MTAEHRLSCFVRIPGSASPGATFLTVVQNHYRYYQFYGNTLIVMGAIAGRGPGVLAGYDPLRSLPVDLAFILLFTIASRDALRKYYARADELLQRSS